jgi:hypothetical protein
VDQKRGPRRGKSHKAMPNLIFLREDKKKKKKKEKRFVQQIMLANLAQ